MIARCSPREEAVDPSTPCERLLELLNSYPDEVLGNPAFALAEFALPGFAKRLQANQWRIIAENGAADEDWLWRTARQFGIHESVPAQRMGSVDWDLACRADLPADLLAALASHWTPEGVHTPGIELAARRLSADADPVRDWRAAVPMAFLLARRGSIDERCQSWRVPASLVFHGALAPNAPVVEAIAALGRWDAGCKVASAAGTRNRMVAGLWSYTAAGRIRHRGARTGSVVLRGMIRRWHNGGKLGPLPPRFEGIWFSSRRVTDPWDRSSPVSFRELRVSKGEFPVPCGRMVTDALKISAPHMHQLAMISSTLCPPDRLVAAATNGNWMFRLSAAVNPLTPPAVRAVLREDVHWIVRGAALESLAARAAIEVKP